MTVQREPTQQALYEMVKRLRKAIRTEHEIAADRDLNAILPAAEAAWEASVNKGTEPDPVTFARKWAKKAVA